jgi:hypothetical protein
MQGPRIPAASLRQGTCSSRAYGEPACYLKSGMPYRTRIYRLAEALAGLAARYHKRLR